jgi:hypothetical protein
MSLLTPNDDLHPAYIHPDRIAFQFCYASPPAISAFAARVKLKQLVADGRDLGGMALTFTMPVEGVAGGVRVKFTKPSASRPFYFKVFLNPLEFLRSPLTLEAQKDGRRNFLSMGDTSADNSAVAALVAELLVPIETALDRLADQLAKAVKPDSFSLLLEWRLHALELCADLRTDDPGRIVERAYAGIRKNFKNTIGATYQSAAAYHGVEADSLMAWGFAQKGERIKAYEKTTRRVRFECALDKHALDKLLGDIGSTRKLDRPDDFLRVCKLLAIHAAGRFQHLTSAVRGSQREGRSPIQLLTLAASGFPASTVEQALLTLGRNGRISRAFSPSLIRTWLARGILRHTVHGYYTETDEFSSALRSVVHLGDNSASAPGHPN